MKGPQTGHQRRRSPAAVCGHDMSNCMVAGDTLVTSTPHSSPNPEPAAYDRRRLDVATRSSRHPYPTHLSLEHLNGLTGITFASRPQPQGHSQR